MTLCPLPFGREERQKALAASRLDAGFEGFGFDIDPNAVALANANAKLAGVGIAAALRWQT